MAPTGSRRSLFGKLSSQVSSSSSLTLSALQIITQTTLCKRCQSLRIQPLRDGECFFHGTPGEILASARAGCPFCSLLFDNFDLGRPSLPVRIYGIRRKLSLQEKASSVEEGDIEALRVLNGHDWDDNNPFSHKLALYTTDDDLAAASIRRRPFLEDFDSDECFSLIKSWLDNCVYHHSGCDSPIISQLPTRVLDVGIRGSMKDPILFTPPSRFRDSYIALSYCWGSSETRFILTKQKSLLPKPTFTLDTLPKTISNAVTITKKLGFRYLWIDALCIIQEGDNGEDFLRESATMHEVYGKATLTLAAAAAADVREGIFRKPARRRVSKCKIAYDLPDGTSGNAFVEFEDVVMGGSRVDEPLNTRGWTFQERILSPRAVIFYKDQISWDCISTLINSTGPLNPLVNYSQDMPGRYSDYISTVGISDRTEPQEQAKYMEYWRRLVQFYSRRNLTRHDDKLRAISGLVQLIQTKIKDSYEEGIWASDGFAQILWHRDEEASLLPRPESRFPSWSWASIASPIKFFSINAYHKKPEDSVPDGVRLDRDPVFESLTQSAKHGKELDTRRRLILHGYLHHWLHSFGGATARRVAHADVILRDNPEAGGFIFDSQSDMETMFSTTEKYPYFLLYPINYTTRMVAIVLRKVSTTYRRVGMFLRYNPGLNLDDFETWMSKWDQVVPETVIIE